MSSALILGTGEGGSSPSESSVSAVSSDGRITAEQILNTWTLDADMVVFSACETGLGRKAGGEGYLGFAQALFIKGARSLVLSQWAVDDAATSLLMVAVLPEPARQAAWPLETVAKSRIAGRGQAVATQPLPG